MEQKTGLSLKVLLSKDLIGSCGGLLNKWPSNLLTTNQGFQRLITSVALMYYSDYPVFCSDATREPIMVPLTYGIVTMLKYWLSY